MTQMALKKQKFMIFRFASSAAILILLSMTGIAKADNSIISLGTALMSNPQIENVSGEAGTGQQICLSGGRPNYDCRSSTTLGEGICLSTGRPSYECSSYLKPAEGLCLAKGQPTYNCSSVTEAIALEMEIIDVSWAWDNFYDEYNNSQWRCRGLNTGQFADDDKCSSKPRLDNTWPRMQL